MSLSTRLTLKTLVIIASLLALSGVAWWGMTGLDRDLDTALDEYDQLRQVYELAVSIEQARVVLRTDPGNAGRLRPMVTRTLLELEDPGLALRPELVQELKGYLLVVNDAFSSGPGGRLPDEVDVDAMIGALGGVTNKLANEAEQIERRIAQVGIDADRRRVRVKRWVGGTAVSASALVVVIGVWQYLAVMRPLRRLERGVNRLARGEFTQQLRATGDREFVRLAEDFTSMAQQLRELYQSLEDKVRERSRQLAQSERLASVGFLAAGVAHEINNPLAIIAGEAELALGSLPEGVDSEVRQGLMAIRDEAFRCKAITQKLLSLARPGSGQREEIDLRQLAEDVVSLVRTLPQHQGRSLQVQGDAAVNVRTDPAQLKQVVLNLVINALEAADPGTGQVVISVQRPADRPTIKVRDNGQGIDPDTLARVFEPFYTEKNSPSTPGLGLGLSISHAIISDLGGTLAAASPGPGRGSTFTIELPLSERGKVLP
ncbi:MAG: ATP-binding protein [Planctomycetota bacterium]